MVWREYSNPSSLRYHIIRVHGRNLDQLVYEALHIIMACKRGTKVYNGQLKCRYCGKRFRYVSELRKHIIREHPEHLKKLEDAEP